MAQFVIHIVRQEPDPDYAEKYAAWLKEENRVSAYFPNQREACPAPERFLAVKVLDFEADEEQFKAIRKAALEVL